MTNEEAIEEFNFFNEGDYITRNMSIAKDIILKELQQAKSDLYEANNRINDLLDIVKQKDKIISAMAEDLNDFYDDNAFEYRKRTIEDTIKKFEERCK